MIDGRMASPFRTLALIAAMLVPAPVMTGAAQAAAAGPTWDGTPLGASWNTPGSRRIGRLYDPYAEEAETQRGSRADVADAGQGASARKAAPTGAASNESQWLATPMAMAVQIAPPAQEAQPSPAEPPADAVESLRGAIIAALKQNPEIQIALARQDDARYGVHEAWSGYLPHVDATVAYGREYNDPYNAKGVGSPSNSSTLTRKEAAVTLNQNVWDFGTTINDIKRARAAYKSAQWATRERIEGIAYDITSAYLNVLERQKLVDLAQGEIAANEKTLKMVTIQEDLGLTTPADVSRAKARLENVQAQLLDRKSALQQAREAYRRLTDHLPGKAAEVASAAPALPVSAQEAVALIDDHNPRMAQAVQDRRSLERQRASQTGTFFPKVGLMAQGNWKDDVQGPTNFANDARAMVTVSYSFFNGGRDIAIRNRLSARLREADYEVDRRRREVEQDIRIDFNALEAAREKIATIESEIASAERVAELYRQQFREGRRSVFDLLDSQQILYDARAKQVTNNTSKMLAEFRVLQQLGGLFDHVSGGEALPDIATPAPGSERGY
jgi:outer membrane protein, adhesin transport system